jgi:hypothetical protein
LVAALVAPFAGAPAPATSFASPTGSTLTTDRPQYTPGQIVDITGTGFSPTTTYAIAVRRPDGSFVKGDGTFKPGWDTTTTYASGHMVYSYKLDDVQGLYQARVYPATWGRDWTRTPPASVTFTDPPGAGSSQCANGATGNPPTLLPCSGSNWDDHLHPNGHHR